MQRNNNVTPFTHFSKCSLVSRWARGSLIKNLSSPGQNKSPQQLMSAGARVRLHQHAIKLSTADLCAQVLYNPLNGRRSTSGFFFLSCLHEGRFGK